MEAKGVLPRRADWQGKEHEECYEALKQNFSGLKDDHLTFLLGQVGKSQNNDIRMVTKDNHFDRMLGLR